MSEPCIITVAITGSVARKSHNPAVPESVTEQIESTHEAFEAGAALVHYHSRHDDGSPGTIPEKFAEFQQGIRKHCPGIIVQFSTGGRSGTGSDLEISQADLDSLIRSKAAMYTILETITGSVGMQQQDLETFFVAGTFGAYIDPESAIAIGMIPDLPLKRYRSLGNSSLGGATRILEDRGCFDRINRIRDGITYMELNVNQDFMNRFSAAKFLPHTDTSRFASVRWPADH